MYVLCSLSCCREVNNQNQKRSSRRPREARLHIPVRQWTISILLIVNWNWSGCISISICGSETLPPTRHQTEQRRRHAAASSLVCVWREQRATFASQLDQRPLISRSGFSFLFLMWTDRKFNTNVVQTYKSGLHGLNFIQVNVWNITCQITFEDHKTLGFLYMKGRMIPQRNWNCKKIQFGDKKKESINLKTSH